MVISWSVGAKLRLLKCRNFVQLVDTYVVWRVALTMSNTWRSLTSFAANKAR